MTETKRIVLAFDIEKAGPRALDPILGIGASVVDQDFNELDSLFLPAYFPNQTKFDERCWDEFWSKYENTLNSLTYDGILTPEERAEELAETFQEFRRKWETYAKENEYDYYFVADTNVIDAEAINQLLFATGSDDYPIPYSATDGTYADFVNLSDYQRGILAVVDPEFNTWWGMSDRIKELFDVPPQSKNYDHNPANDAYTIAYDFLVLLGIKDRTIDLKENPVNRTDNEKKVPVQAQQRKTIKSNYQINYRVNYRTLGLFGFVALGTAALGALFFKRS